MDASQPGSQRESSGDLGHRRLRGFRPKGCKVSLCCKATIRLASPHSAIAGQGRTAAAYSCGESAELDGSLGADMLTALREGE